MSLSHNLRHGYGCRPSGAQTEVRGPAPVRGPLTAVGRDLQKADRPECGFPVCRQSPLDTPCWSLSPHPENIYHLRLTTAQNRTEQTDHVTPGVLVHTCRTDLLTRRDSSLTPFLFNYICRTKTLNLIPVQSGFGISDLYFLHFIVWSLIISTVDDTVVAVLETVCLGQREKKKKTSLLLFKEQDVTDTLCQRKE